jgi:hypothetical protein
MTQGVKMIMVGFVSLLLGAGGAVLAMGATAASADKMPVTDRAAIETIVQSSRNPARSDAKSGAQGIGKAVEPARR